MSDSEKPPIENVPEILNNTAVFLTSLAACFQEEIEKELEKHPDITEEELQTLPITIQGSAAFFTLMIAQSEEIAGQVLSISRGATEEVENRKRPTIIVPGLKIIKPGFIPPKGMFRPKR